MSGNGTADAPAAKHPRLLFNTTSIRRSSGCERTCRPITAQPENGKISHRISQHVLRKSHSTSPSVRRIGPKKSFLSSLVRYPATLCTAFGFLNSRFKPRSTTSLHGGVFFFRGLVKTSVLYNVQRKTVQFDSFDTFTLSIEININTHYSSVLY